MDQDPRHPDAGVTTWNPGRAATRAPRDRHTPRVVTSTELSELAAQDRGEITLETGLTYDGITPVLIHLSKRDRRYGVTDGGGAVAASGSNISHVAFPERISIDDYEVNVSRKGIVVLSAVAPTPTWLETICELVGRGSVALYEHLLDVD